MTGFGDDDAPMAPVGGKKPRGSKRFAPMPGGRGEFDERDARCAWFPADDLGNAKRLIERYGETLFHIAHKKHPWYGWDKLRWNNDEGSALARKCAHGVYEGMRREIAALDAKGGHDDWAGALEKHRHDSGNSPSFSNALREAEPYLSRRIEDLDSDPWLFYTANEVLRLGPSIVPVQREPAHLVTKLAGARYDASAAAPRWAAFVEQALPDPDLRAFVQRSVGYSASGDASREVFFIAWGLGRTGKSTFLSTIAEALGQYSAAIPVELVLRSGKMRTGDEPTAQFSALHGVRFVHTTEPDYGAAFDEGLIKTITGRDTMRIRDLNEGVVDFKPKFKLWVLCNDKPSVSSGSNAFWERVLPIPFTVTVPETQRDAGLKDALRGELPGILNWILEGVALYCEHGLEPPKAVRDIVESYRDDMDPLHRFLADCVQQMPGESVARKKLYAAYVGWMDRDTNGEPMKDKAFGQKLTAKGYRRRHSGGTLYVDVALNSEGAFLCEKGEDLIAAQKRR